MSKRLEQLNGFLTCFAIISSCLAIHKLFRIPGRKWYEIHWLPALLTGVIAFLALLFFNFPLAKAFVILGAIATLASQTRHPVTFQIDWKKAALILSITLVSFLISEIPLTSLSSIIRNKLSQSQGLKGTTTSTAIAAITPEESLYKQSLSVTPTLKDPLDGSSAEQWVAGGGCSFSNGSYHSTVSNPGGNNLAYMTNCWDQSSSYSNFALKVDYKLDKGEMVNFLIRGQDPNYPFGDVCGFSINTIASNN